jgi:Cof subfamily protein (haloacid dehalogenase superfamily)
MKKIIAVDIDGTLINSDLKIGQKTKEALIKAQEKGHIVVIASGRDKTGVMQYARELNFDKYGGLLSNNNGCLVTNYKSGEVLIKHKLNKEDVKEILTFTKGFDLDPMVFKDGNVITYVKNSSIVERSARINQMGLIVDENLIENLDFDPTNIIYCQENPKIMDEKIPLIESKYKDDFSLVRSTPNYYEVMPNEASKGESLLEIAKYYGMDIKDVYAFGDEENDLDMIQKAGVGVAMGNASQIIKEASDYVTLSNDQDGIAYFLYKFKLI